MKRYIKDITVFVSASCNMNCEFCFLHKNSTSKEYEKVIKDSWRDGSYVNNITNVIKKINGTPETVDNLCIWGGEPSLGFTDLIDNNNFKKLLEAFPNLQYLFASSNFTTNPKFFTDFFDGVNDAFKNAGRECIKINCQLSIDGPDGEISKHGHPGTFEQYYKNIEFIFKHIYEQRYSNIREIRFMVNSVIPMEVMDNEIKNYEGMEKYTDDMYNFFEKVNEINRQCRVENGTTYISMRKTLVPGHTIPFSFTMEDGINGYYYDRLWQNFINHNKDKYKNVIFSTLNYKKGALQFSGNSMFERNLAQCSQLNCSLCICPDGSIIGCDGSFMVPFKPYAESLKKEGNQYELNFVANSIRNIYNPLKMTDKEIERMNYILLCGYRSSFVTEESLKAGMCRELSLSAQIPYRFSYDPEYTISSVKRLAFYSICDRENVRDTGISFSSGPSQFRYYFNGSLQTARESTTQNHHLLK